MADNVTKKPGISDRTNYPDARETRNRRTSRFGAGANANRSAGRHTFINANTIGFTAAGNEITDSGNGFLEAGFKVGQRISVVGSAGNDASDLEIGAVVAGQIDIADNFPFGLEAAGAQIQIQSFDNRNRKRTAGFP